MDRQIFLTLKDELKFSSVRDVAHKFRRDWSARTIYRVNQARSFKQYKVLCAH